MNTMNNEELTNLIVKELSRHRDRKEITRMVCEHSYLNWNEAEKLVEEVAIQNKRTIAARQSPLLVFVSIGTLVLGIALLAYSLKFIADFAQEDTLARILSLRSGYYILGESVTGLGMTVGGFYGLWKTIAGLLPD